MPRYEYSEGTSNKFWEIELAGSSYTSKWGRIGGSMSISTKAHGDAAAAKKAYDKLVAEKVKKGYVLIGGVPAKKTKAKVAEPAPTRNVDLEKQILAAPDDGDAYIVYGDWLQGQGDVRGELVALQHGKKTKEANALIKKHGALFLGELATKKPEKLELEWFCGFIKKAVIGWPPFSWDLEDESEDGEVDWGEYCKKQLTEFLKLPSTQFIQELELGPVPGEEEMSMASLAEAIDEVKPATLRSLFLGRTGDWDISSTSVAAPDSKSMRGLRTLRIRGGSVTLDKIDLPELTSFVIESGQLDKANLKTIANAKWPKLEKLEIWCGDPNYGASGSAKDLQPIFDATGLKRLKHLGVMNCPFADAVVKALVKSKILAQLETLDLSMGNLSDRGVDVMVAAKGAFAHLAMLNLDDNALTDVSKAKLKGLAKKTEYGKEQSPERAIPRGEDNQYSRYTAVGE
jgi:uncharacterized protein (TIGR02996 family)